MSIDLKQFKHLTKHAHRCHATSEGDYLEVLKEGLELAIEFSKTKNGLVVDVWFDNYSFCVPIKPSDTIEDVTTTFDQVRREFIKAKSK